MTDETRENRLRRQARARGWMLKKSRRRDPEAVDFGTYMLVDADTNALVTEVLDLDELEYWINPGPCPICNQQDCTHTWQEKGLALLAVKT